MTLEQVRSFSIDTNSIEELVFLLAIGKTVQAEFESLDLDQPSWLAPKLRQIRSVIAQKNMDSIARKLEQARMKRESLKTDSEKKRDLDAEISKLEKRMGGGA